MRTGVRGRFFVTSLGLVAATVGAASVYLHVVLERQLIAGIARDLQVRADLVAREAAGHAGELRGTAKLDTLADSLSSVARAQVTLITPEGDVAGDSAVSRYRLDEMGNLLDRPEVKEALRDGWGVSIRHNSTQNERLLHVAVPIRAKGDLVGIARVAQPLTEVEREIRASRNLLIIGALLALALGVPLSSTGAHFVTRSLRDLADTARRMAEGDLAVRAAESGVDEVASLGESLARLASGLESTLDTLRAERDLRARVIEGLVEGVVAIDSEDRIAVANAAAHQMLSLPRPAESAALRLAVRLPGIAELVARARGTPGSVVTELAAGIGGERRLEVGATCVETRPPLVVLAMRDVTTLRRMEARQREFVSNASHELRTPVATVMAAAETLKAGALKDARAAGRFVDMIERNAERLGRLVHDLLQLSRLEAREEAMHVGPVEVGPLVEEVIGSYQAESVAGGIEVRTEVPEGFPPVRADAFALEQVLSNLLSNAIHYSGPGAHVLVRARASEGRAWITVQDDGPGIEARHLPRLFERFYRVDTGRSRERGGTGLGLAIVRHLVEMMGGDVGVDSIVGRGSSFHVSLPCAADPGGPPGLPGA